MAATLDDQGRGVWERDIEGRDSMATCLHMVISEEVGHAPNCIMVEAINQSGACIFLQVDFEGIVPRGMKTISLRAFLGIDEFGDPVA